MVEDQIMNGLEGRRQEGLEMDVDVPDGSVGKVYRTVNRDLDHDLKEQVVL